MSDRTRPEVMVFDIVETLASLDPVQARLEEVAGERREIATWFDLILRDAMGLTAAGDYAPFVDVATSALDAHTGYTLEREQIDHIVAGFGEMTPQAGAVDAVRAAADHGFQVVALSNGSQTNTRGFLERAGVVDLFDEILTVDAARAWKPARAVYDLVVERTGVPASGHALVAVHSWDIHGAHRAGWTTGWCSLLEGKPNASFAHADVISSSLQGVVDGVAALPRPS